MKLTAEQKKMLDQVNLRQKEGFSFRSFGGGLSTAAAYVNGLSQVKGLEIGNYLAGVDLTKEAKAAAQKLTWCEESETPQDAKWADGSASLKEFKMPSGVAVPKNTLMVFRNVITRNTEDRDGDVLQPKGAKVDLKMPLLWQHLSAVPIGKFLAIDEQSDKVLSAYSCLLDLNDLTNDAAKLIEAEAVRISHGFIPTDFRERSCDSEKVPWRGFDIHEFEVMEESLVSVPSNREAVITMFSRNGFKSATMNAIGKELFDHRDDKFWSGVDLKKPDQPTDDVSGRGKMEGEDHDDDEDHEDEDHEEDPKKKPEQPTDDCGKEYSVTVAMKSKSGDIENTTTIRGTSDQVNAQLVKMGLIEKRAVSNESVMLVRGALSDLKELGNSEIVMTRSQEALFQRAVKSLDEFVKATPEDPIEGEEPLIVDGTQTPPKHSMFQFAKGTTIEAGEVKIEHLVFSVSGTRGKNLYRGDFKRVGEGYEIDVQSKPLEKGFSFKATQPAFNLKATVHHIISEADDAELASIEKAIAMSRDVVEHNVFVSELNSIS